MKSSDPENIIQSLREEIGELRRKLIETESALLAIRNGDVDAIVVSGEHGDRIFSLTSSETPYRILIEQINEGAVTVSSKGIILYCNRRFAEIVSRPHETIPGSDFSGYVSTGDKPEFKRLLRIGHKKSINGEVTSKVNNEIIHLNLSMAPLPDDFHGDVCIIVTDVTKISNYQDYLLEMVDERTSELSIANKKLSEDIKKLRKAEKDLKDSEERYSLAVTAACLGTYDNIISRNGSEIIWSDHMYYLFGIGAGRKLSYEDIYKTIHPDDAVRIKEEYLGAIKTHSKIDHEFRVVWPDDSVHWIHAAGNVSADDKPGSIRVNGICRDITKRKIAELELIDSEARYRLLSDTMTQGLLCRGTDGKIISINPAGEKILGISHDESGEKIPDIQLFNEDGMPLPVAERPSVIALRTGRPITGLIKLVFNPVENGYRWLKIDTLPVFRRHEKKPYQVFSVLEDITQRKDHEREILKREQLFRSAFDEGSVPMSLTSKEGVFLKVNRAFCELTGYSVEELMNLTFREITHPDDLEMSIRGKTELKNGDRISGHEKRYIRKDGKSVWVSISIAPVKDENGKWDFFVNHVQDINKRKLAELRLKESKDRFRQLANSIPQLSWMAHADGNIFWFNQRWYDYTGLAKAEAIRTGWQAIWPVEERDSVLSEWNNYILKGEPFEMVNTLKGKDGKYSKFLTRSIPLKAKNGKVEQWFGTHTDISDLIKAENELKQSREKLNIALENGQIGTWEWDLETNEVILDNRAEKMFGCNPDSFEGTLDSMLNCIHEEDIQHVRTAINKAIEGNKAFETIFRTKQIEGGYSFISAKALINRNNEGDATSMTGVCFDVTEMKRGAEQVLIRLNEDLLRSNTDLQQFAYVASHDLQEPLRMVSSFTQLLQLKYRDKLDEDGNEYIRYAVEGSKRMYDLLNGLLAYSRIQTKGKEFTGVDMKSVITKVRENLSLIIEESGAIVQCTELPVIVADESQMIQLVQNLVENSIKFSKRNPEVYISYLSRDGMDVFSVLDKGIGIEPQYFDRIFRIFQRLHRSDQYEGTGIGLAICRRIAERHGGSIWVESVPGEGSTFFFSVPVITANHHGKH